MANDPYVTLGLQRGASADEVKKAYRALSKEWHPDRHKGDPAAEKRFKEINEAYEILGNPERKEAYDRFGSTGGRGGFNPFGGGSGMGGFDARGFGGLGDMLRMMQEMMAEAADEANATLQYELRLHVVDAILGTAVRLEGGDGPIEVQIPPGIQHGQTIALRGKGGKTRSGKRGDVHVHVDVEIPRKLSRAERTLVEEWKKLRG